MPKSQITTPDDSCKIIKRKLLALKRETKFYDWDETGLLADKLGTILELIQKDINDPEVAVDLLSQLFQLDEHCIERCDDSNGYVGDEFRFHAVDVLIPFAQEYKDKDKLADIVFDLISSDDYGCRSGLIDHVAEILPVEQIRNLIKRPMDRYLYQALVFASADAPAYEKILSEGPCGITEPEYPDLAKCYLAYGDTEKALMWANKILDDSNEKNDILEAIYKKTGDQTKLKDLYKQEYLLNPSGENKKKILTVLSKDELHQLESDKTNAIINSPDFSESDMEYLLDQGLIADAENYIYERRGKISGVHFSTPFKKKVKKLCSPLTQTIITRVDLEYFLGPGKSKYNEWAAGYYKSLAKKAVFVDDWKEVMPHKEYYEYLKQKYRLKKIFWQLIDEDDNKEPAW